MLAYSQDRFPEPAETMQEAEFLFTIAEVGVAFAGFATLVVVLSQRFSGERVEVESMRLDSMLRCSLLAVFSALLPYIPHQMGLSEEASWRSSALVLWVGWTAYFLHRIHTVRRSDSSALAFTRATNMIAMVVVHPAGIIASACGALGLLGSYAASTYLFSVLCLLAVSANLFLQLVNGLSRGPGDA